MGSQVMRTQGEKRHPQSQWVKAILLTSQVPDGKRISNFYKMSPNYCVFSGLRMHT